MRWISFVWLSLIILSFLSAGVQSPGRAYSPGDDGRRRGRKGTREKYYSLYDHISDVVERALPLVHAGGRGGGRRGGRCLCWYGNGKGGDALTIALM
ncbi:MAG TPA: hypothetical protein VHC96_14620 [Puia sp.]|nr:hypothetical protein [Puia sp.]